MATTIQGKYKQVNADGTITLYHFQTNADIVIDGTTKKVPLISDISNWNSIRTEVINARGSQVNLDARLDGFDAALEATSLLATIKTVDGSTSGLDSDSVDGCGVNDASSPSTTVLWTSSKIKELLDSKVDDTEVATSATANKLLKLNANGALPASITGNSATATKLETQRLISLVGDVSGSANFDGSRNIEIEIQVGDNTHNHSGVTFNGPTSVENSSAAGNITNFKLSGVTKSYIDSNGNFSGKAANADAVDGRSVNDAGTTTNDLLTASKVLALLGLKQDANDIVITANSIEINGTLIKWGTVDMANKTTAIVSLGTGYAVAPTILISDECADFTWICKKKPSATTATQFEVITNKSVATAKVTWIAIGA